MLTLLMPHLMTSLLLQLISKMLIYRLHHLRNIILYFRIILEKNIEVKLHLYGVHCTEGSLLGVIIGDICGNSCQH